MSRLSIGMNINNQAYNAYAITWDSNHLNISKLSSRYIYHKKVTKKIPYDKIEENFLILRRIPDLLRMYPMLFNYDTLASLKLNLLRRLFFVPSENTRTNEVLRKLILLEIQLKSERLLKYKQNKKNKKNLNLNFKLTKHEQKTISSFRTKRKT